ncbi:hypothetical protein A2U01_0027836, partial [Trifolium medium]|nr:hypothetical protein [Trifolium medium]
MENWQEQLDALRGDVDHMAEKLDRVLEVLANLNLHSQHDMGLNATAVGANPLTDLSSSNVAWPPFGLPVGYTTSGYMYPSNKGSTSAQVNQVPMGTNTEVLASQPRAHQVLPRTTIPQKSQGDPINAYQSSGMPNVGPGANSAIPQIEE